MPELDRTYYPFLSSIKYSIYAFPFPQYQYNIISKNLLK